MTRYAHHYRHVRPEGIGAEPVRRSVLSERAGWPTTTEDPQAGYATQRGLSSLLPAEKPQPRVVPLDPLAELRKLVRALVPTCKLRLSVEEEENGVGVPVRLYKVVCYDPQVIGAAEVCGQGHSPAAACEGLRTKWARARRDFAVDKLVRECERLAGEAFTPQAQAELRAELGGCEYREFEAKAARWRKAAYRHAT